MSRKAEPKIKVYPTNALAWLKLALTKMDKQAEAELADKNLKETSSCVSIIRKEGK
jgi:hypothetical protein